MPDAAGKSTNPIKTFDDLSRYVERNVDADPVGTLQHVLDFYGPKKLSSFNTRRHRATISMVVATAALARRVKLLEGRLDAMANAMADNMIAKARKDLLKPSPKRAGKRK